MADNDGGPQFRLAFSDWLRDRLKYLVHRSIVLGARDRFARALTEIETALRTTPTTWGDPIRRLDALRLTHYRRVHDRIVVYYGVHDVEPVVWLTAVDPLRNSPFWAGEG